VDEDRVDHLGIFHRAGFDRTSQEEVAMKRHKGPYTNKVDFRLHCQWYGLKPKDFGRKLILEGQEYTIAGLRPDAPKDVICIKRVSDGKVFVTSDDVIREVLGIPDTDPLGKNEEHNDGN